MKSVPAEKQVAFILPGMRDLHIQNWIAADHATIMVLPFGSFMSQLHDNYLLPDWEDHVHDKILNSKLDLNKESFWAWSQHVIKLNCLLQNTSSVFNGTTLCNQLDAHLNNGLKEHIKYSKAKKERPSNPGLMQCITWMRLRSMRTNATENSLRKPSTNNGLNVWLLRTTLFVICPVDTMLPPLLLLQILLPPLFPYLS